MADRPLFIRLSMPSGLEDALEGLAREILRAQPKDLLEFSADYFEGLLRSRNKGNYSILSQSRKLLFFRTFANVLTTPATKLFLSSYEPYSSHF